MIPLRPGPKPKPPANHPCSASPTRPRSMALTPPSRRPRRTTPASLKGSSQTTIDRIVKERLHLEHHHGEPSFPDPTQSTGVASLSATTPASSRPISRLAWSGLLLNHSPANPPGQDVSPSINIDDEMRLINESRASCSLSCCRVWFRVSRCHQRRES